MSYECCPTCLGIGSYLRSEWTRDEELMYRKITVRRACETCGGSGRATASGGLRTLHCSPRRAARDEDGRAADAVTLSYLAVLALPGYVLYQIFSDSRGETWRLKIALACGAFALLVLMLGFLPKSTRVSRQIAVLLVIAGICGGLAFEFLRT